VSAEFTSLQQRRFLVMRSKAMQTVNHVWVDDDGSCNREGVHLGQWHVYASRPAPHAQPAKLFLRCPITLDSGERERLETDQPQGRIAAVLRSAREGLRLTRSEQRDAARGKYSWDADGS
jgi:hypothetical protein